VVGYLGGGLSIEYAGSGFSGLPILPNLIQPRYLIVAGANPLEEKIRRKIIVGRKAAWDFIQAGGDLTYQTFTALYPEPFVENSFELTNLANITFLRGEARTIDGWNLPRSQPTARSLTN
jgi:hypothetical protein